jgi:tryptophan-rich sensory protein
VNFLASKAQLRASFLRWSLFLVPLIVLLGLTAGQAGSPDTVWFQSLVKPAIFPPPAAFGIAWAMLYVLIGFSLALVVSALGAYGRELAVGLFALHFVFNLAWTPTFFGAQSMIGGLIVLGLALASLLGVLWAFWRVRRLAAALLVPYFCWLCFALALNYMFLVENPDGGAGARRGAAVEVKL